MSSAVKKSAGRTNGFYLGDVIANMMLHSRQPFEQRVAMFRT